VPCEVQRRSGGRVFKLGLLLAPVSRLASCDLRQRLIALRISHRPQFVQGGIVETFFRQPQLVRKKLLHKFHLSRIGPELVYNQGLL